MNITISDEERGMVKVYLTTTTEECGDVVAELQMNGGEYGNAGGFPDEDVAIDAVMEFLAMCTHTFNTSKMIFDRNEDNDLVLA